MIKKNRIPGFAIRANKTENEKQYIHIAAIAVFSHSLHP